MARCTLTIHGHEERAKKPSESIEGHSPEIDCTASQLALASWLPRCLFAVRNSFKLLHCVVHKRARRPKSKPMKHVVARQVVSTSLKLQYFVVHRLRQQWLRQQWISNCR